MLMYILLYIFIASLCYLLLKYIIKPYLSLSFYKKQGIKTSFSPGLGILPKIIHSTKEYDDALYFAKNLSKEDPNSKALCANFVSGTMVYLIDSELIKDFAFKDHLFEKFIPKFFHILFGQHALSIVQGEEWKNQRKVISQQFHFDLLKSNIFQITSIAKEAIASIKTENLKSFDLLEQFQYITGESIGRLFFGSHLSSYTFKGQKLSTAITQIQNECTQILFSIPSMLFGSGFLCRGILPSHRKAIQNMKDFRQLCQNIINDRVAKKDQVTSDFLGSLIASGDKLNKDSVIDNFIAFFIAGMDTTAHLITIMVYLYLKYPEFQEKLHNEMNSYYSENPNIEDLKKMEYFDAFIKEALRFYTPGPGTLMRIAKQDLNIGSLNVRKGDIVQVSPFSNHFTEKYFKEADKFNPDRWLNGEFPTDPYAFSPFWAGPRNCIGQHLALIEAKIVFCEFLKSFNMELEKDFKLIMGFSQLYESKIPIRVNVTYK